MLDIGRSGVLAYRTALAVTAENVANVGTEGYRRRDVATVAAGGAQATPVSTPTGGQGVSVVEVRRAFDALVADRARSANAGLAAAEAHLAGASAIETLMIPGDDGIDGTLRDFFDAIARFAASPTDMVTRSLTLRSGEALAEGIAGLARGMVALRADLLAESAAVARNAQAALAELAQISQRLGAASAPGVAGAAALHPLADRRDALLDDLARLLPVSVALAENGRPTVRLGSSAGPLLLEVDRSAVLSTSASDQLTLHVRSADGTASETRMIPGGQLGGMARALGALDMATQELDAFARTLAGAMNAVHQGGVDLTGRPGARMFAIDGWRAETAPGNGGSVSLSLTNTDTTGPRTAFDLVFDGAAGLWRALDANGQVAGAARDTLLLPGVRVDLAGPARNGDRITLLPTTGRAADLRFSIGDPAALAAAGAFATAASPANKGTASLSATMRPAAEAEIPLLASNLADELVDLLGGLVGLMPAGAQSAQLASLGRVATTTLPPMADAFRLGLTMDGKSDGFDIAGFPDAGSVAAALNDGTLRSDAGRSLAGMGVTAATDADGRLVLARPGSDIPVQALLSGSNGIVSGAGQSGQAAGGTIQILTRNGVHVSGTPLSAVGAAALLTPQNGFLAGAAYDATALTATSGAGYRGIEIGRFDIQGMHSAVLPAPSLQTGSALPLQALPARSLTLADTSGATAEVALPDGASAALIATRMKAALPGIEATASTALEVSGFASGNIRFGLTGSNATPVEVSTTLAGARAEALAVAINGVSAATGIRAEVSPDGARLLLVQDAGYDIALSGLTLSEGSGLVVRSATPEGKAAGAAADWLPGTALRQVGQVTVAGAQGFGLSDGTSSIGSQPRDSGSFFLNSAAAGAQWRMNFADIPDMAEGGLAHRVHFAGRTVEVAHPAGTPAEAVVASLAEELRRHAPDATLVGRRLSHLPADGSAMSLRLEGAEYTVRMEAGAPVVTGPETGRISAALDTEGRLVLTARGVTGSDAMAFSSAPAFGFGAGEAVLRLAGQKPDPGGLPGTVALSLGGVTYELRLDAGGELEVPPGFPGTSGRDPETGGLSIDLVAPAEGIRMTAEPATGFGGQEAAVRADGKVLVLSGPSDALDPEVTARGALGRAVDLRALPAEDLVVLMTSSGNLRLAGAMAPGTPPADPGALDLVVMDARSGHVVLQDRVTGHAIASGALDTVGRVSLGGLEMTVSGTPATGDRFAILPAAAGSANADTALALSRLRNADPATGSPGLTESFSRIQADAGVRVAAANRAVATSTAAADAANRARDSVGAVDLDVEAARLLELQQTYQASAQAISIARDLFDTILRMF